MIKQIVAPRILIIIEEPKKNCRTSTNIKIKNAVFFAEKRVLLKERCVFIFGSQVLLFNKIFSKRIMLQVRKNNENMRTTHIEAALIAVT